jgi:hypothetical protein
VEVNTSRNYHNINTVSLCRAPTPFSPSMLEASTASKPRVSCSSPSSLQKLRFGLFLPLLEAHLLLRTIFVILLPLSQIQFDPHDSSQPFQCKTHCFVDAGRINQYSTIVTFDAETKTRSSLPPQIESR